MRSTKNTCTLNLIEHYVEQSCRRRFLCDHATRKKRQYCSREEFCANISRAAFPLVKKKVTIFQSPCHNVRVLLAIFTFIGHFFHWLKHSLALLNFVLNGDPEHTNVWIREMNRKREAFQILSKIYFFSPMARA